MAQNDFSPSVTRVNFDRYTLPDTAEPLRNATADTAQQDNGSITTIKQPAELIALPADGYTLEDLLTLNHTRLAKCAWHWYRASLIAVRRADDLESRNSALAREMKHQRHQNTALHNALQRATRDWRAAVHERDTLRQQVINAGGFPMIVITNNRPNLPA